MIAFSLSEDQELIRRTAHDLARDELRPKARQHERDRTIPAGLRKRFFELGFPLLALPESAGGQGLSAVTWVLAIEELCFGDAGTAVELESFGAAALAVIELGSDEQIGRLLGPFTAADGHQKRGALAYSEPTQPAIGGFSTTARRDGGDYVLDGTKSLVLQGGIADLHLVVASLEGSVAAFAVEGKPPGLSAGARRETLGLDCVHVGEVVLDGVRVPARNRLEGGGQLETALSRLFGRLALEQAARSVGAARAAYEYALAYAQDRTAFGKPVAHFQAIAFLLSDMLMEVDSARWCVWRAASRWDALSGDNPPALETVLACCAIAQVQAVEAAQWIADRGVQILGGAGYVQDHPSEKWMRDAKTLALVGVSREDSNRLIAAAELGAEVSRAQGEPDVVLPGNDLSPVVT